MNDIDSTVFTGDKLQNQFTAYVERALYNNRISYYRKQKQKSSNEFYFSTDQELIALGGYASQALDPHLDMSYLSSETVKNNELAAALKNISERDMRIIRMHLSYGYTYKKISAVLGMKEETVRVRFFRTLKKIRHQMEGRSK